MCANLFEIHYINFVVMFRFLQNFAGHHGSKKIYLKVAEIAFFNFAKIMQW